MDPTLCATYSFPPMTLLAAHISLPFSLWRSPSGVFWHLFNVEICTYKHLCNYIIFVYVIFCNIRTVIFTPGRYDYLKLLIHPERITLDLRGLVVQPIRNTPLWTIIKEPARGSQRKVSSNVVCKTVSRWAVNSQMFEECLICWIWGRWKWSFGKRNSKTVNHSPWELN